VHRWVFCTNAIKVSSSRKKKKDMKPKVQTSELTTSSSKVKPRSLADRITKLEPASSSRVLYEVDCDSMEIDRWNQFHLSSLCLWDSSHSYWCFEVQTHRVYMRYRHLGFLWGTDTSDFYEVQTPRVLMRYRHLRFSWGTDNSVFMGTDIHICLGLHLGYANVVIGSVYRFSIFNILAFHC
jgi:hypothetical protein